MRKLLSLLAFLPLNALAAVIQVQICATVPTGNTVSPACATFNVTVPDPAPCPVCAICPAPTVCPTCPPQVVCIPAPVLQPPSGTDNAILTWDPVTTATGYRVYYGSSSGLYLQPLGSGLLTTLTTFTISGLAAGRWFFAVTAHDVQGNESAFSNEVFKDIASSAPAPAPAPTPTPTPAPTESPSGTELTAPGSATIVDHVGAVWMLAPKSPAVEGGVEPVILRNAVIQGTGTILCYSSGVVYAASGGDWFKWTNNTTGFGSFSDIGVTKPAGCP